MEYMPLRLERVLRVTRLYSLHYFQFATGYVFPGERHNFWELVYLDRGEADIGAGRRVLRLTQGQLILHRPNEFHSIWANYASAPNIMVLSFAASAPCMRRLHGYCATLSPRQRGILRQIIDEGQRCFGPLLDVADSLVPLDSAPLGSRQLIGNLLEQLLILLLRDCDAATPALGQPDVAALPAPVDVMDRLIRHMRAHPDGSLTFEAIQRASGLGPTALKALFHRHADMGVMTYYRHIRLEEARRLLRTGDYNITQTAELLGYPSVHAFSRQFTRVMGITPQAYVRSVRG